MPLSDSDLDTLTWTVLGEAANQGVAGQAAVANVIKNRSDSPRFPNDPVAVATQGNSRGIHQFSAWNSAAYGGDNPMVRWPANTPAFNAAKQVVQQVFNGDLTDNTGGALFYYAPGGMDPAGSTPSWLKSEAQNGTLTIGDQVFVPTHPVPPEGIPLRPATIPTSGGPSLEQRDEVVPLAPYPQIATTTTSRLYPPSTSTPFSAGDELAFDPVTGDSYPSPFTAGTLYNPATGNLDPIDTPFNRAMYGQESMTGGSSPDDRDYRTPLQTLSDIRAQAVMTMIAGQQQNAPISDVSLAINPGTSPPEGGVGTTNPADYGSVSAGAGSGLQTADTIGAAVSAAASSGVGAAASGVAKLPAKLIEAGIVPATRSAPSPKPQTIVKGGQTYVVGQTYKLSNGSSFRANADGSFSKVSNAPSNPTMIQLALASQAPGATANLNKTVDEVKSTAAGVGSLAGKLGGVLGDLFNGGGNNSPPIPPASIPLSPGGASGAAGVGATGGGSAALPAPPIPMDWLEGSFVRNFGGGVPQTFGGGQPIADPGPAPYAPYTTTFPESPTVLGGLSRNVSPMTLEGLAQGLAGVAAYVAPKTVTLPVQEAATAFATSGASASSHSTASLPLNLQANASGSASGSRGASSSGSVSLEAPIYTDDGIAGTAQLPEDVRPNVTVPEEPSQQNSASWSQLIAPVRPAIPPSPIATPLSWAAPAMKTVAKTPSLGSTDYTFLNSTPAPMPEPKVGGLSPDERDEAEAAANPAPVTSKDRSNYIDMGEDENESPDIKPTPLGTAPATEPKPAIKVLPGVAPPKPVAAKPKVAKPTYVARLPVSASAPHVVVQPTFFAQGTGQELFPQVVQRFNASTNSFDSVQVYRAAPGTSASLPQNQAPGANAAFRSGSTTYTTASGGSAPTVDIQGQQRNTYGDAANGIGNNMSLVE